jgi:hypothetical protein
MTALETLLLRCVHRATIAMKLPPAMCDRYRYGAALLEYKEGIDHGPRLDLGAWLGHEPDDAERRAALRALDRLENAKLLTRTAGSLGDGSRRNRVRLTPTGHALARQLARDDEKHL